jgi:hypothetical protein
MKKLAAVAFLMGMFGLIAAVNAADKDDPTGTWKFKVKFGDKEVERTMKLKNEDGKVTGTVSGFGKGGDNKIEDGKFKDGELSFSVTTMRKDAKSVTKYSAKVTGDTMKGTMTRDRDGKETKTEFEAKKEEPKKD